MTDIETINGHQYTVTRDDQGNILSMVACDPPPATTVPPIIAKVKALIPILKAGTATPLQQQQALAATLALLLNLSDF